MTRRVLIAGLGDIGVLTAIKLAKRPVIYAGGGVVTGSASEELRALGDRGCAMEVMTAGVVESLRKTAWTIGAKKSSGSMR